MSQQRITLFFPSTTLRKRASPDAKCHFLALPFSIRRQIYHEAGLLSGQMIHMNYWATRRRRHITSHQEDYDHRDDFHLPPLPLSLFAVCRVVGEELTRLFYGENRFAITRRAPRGLRALEQFRESTLAIINFLIVRVNLASCRGLCCGPPNRRCGNSHFPCIDPSHHDAPLSHVSASHQTIISNWQRVCRRWAETVQPGHLSLYVICDCEDRRTVDLIVKPLLSVPILQDCGLRLARDYDDDLQSVAKETALRLTGRSTPVSLQPFRFLDLPKEIQLNILQQTNLASGYEICCRQGHMRYPRSCRGNGTATSNEFMDSSLLRCFCYKGHSAFNFRCGDYCESLGFPSAFFLVCRELREAAIEVFYGRNEFTVSMVHPMLSRDNPAPGDSTSIIIPGLKQFTKGSLLFLTSLKLEFEPAELNMLQPSQAGWNNWIDTIDLLSKEVTPAILNLEIRLTENFYVSVWNLREEPNSVYEERMWDTYTAFIQPVAALKGLKNFFVHLNWGTSCGIPGKGVLDGRQALEQKLERMVMGEGYEAWQCGKEVRMDMTGAEY
ncbi:hypothetical protein B0O99DRAFT_745760 [Bisporella sp. PMI_857]|nr:hypothetical protein B0O99DRAFT_745760 [Bisporella sp. PMI_857]